MKSRSSMWRIALLSLLLSLFGVVGSTHAAKVTTGTLSGIVTNAVTAAPVVGAAVKATNSSTGAVTSTTSTSTGSYKLTLAPATYSVECSATGYQTATRTGIAILAGKTTTVNIGLQPAVQTLNHASRISTYAGPATCLACHPTSSSGTDLLTDVFKSVHFQVRTANAKIDIPGAGSHGMVDRACGLPGTNLFAGNFAGIAVSETGAVTYDGCGKCHIAYRPPYKYPTALDAKNDIDCLICHAAYYSSDWDDPTVIATYGSNTQPRARIVAPLADGTLAWTQDRSLKTAQSVGGAVSTHACMRCHEHNMGGYKRATPYDAADDVHAAKNMPCTQCHIPSKHMIPRGNYVTDMMANETTTIDMSCERCHGVSPHIANNAADLNKHSANVSCEVCHIPSMTAPENTAIKSWAPYTLDPRTGQWSDTRAVLSNSFYAPFTTYLEPGTTPLVRWFDAAASMLAQPVGSYATRASTGGCSKLFAFKQFSNGMLFDAGWLPGPSSDPLFDMVGGTWPFSMKFYYENNWAKLLAFGFVDPTYQTAQAYWQARPDMAAMLNNFPMMLFMHRATYLAEAGTIIGTPPPGPQNAATYPGLTKAINIGMGNIGIEMGYFPVGSVPETVGKNLWSGSFFGMWVPINMDPTSPFQGELASFITMSHSIKGAATLGTTTTNCYTCHYTTTEYAAQTPVTKRFSFAQLGWPNIDTNPLIDPLYDRIIATPVPAADRIVFSYVVGKTTQSLKISTYVVDSLTREPMPSVTVNGTLTGPAGQAGLPYTANVVSDATGVALVTFTQKTLLSGVYTFKVNSMTYNGVITPSTATSSYTKP